MIKYLRLSFSFDPAALQQDTRRIGEEYWKLHFQVKHYSGEWSAIPLRSIGGNTDNGFLSPDETDCYQDTSLLQSSSYLQQVLQQFNCPLLAVRLLKLAAGARVHEHKDRDLCYEEGLVRFHIPVQTHPEVDFFLDGEKMMLEEGSCWYMNFNLPHSLHNKSQMDRIHLVIDARVNEWVTDLFNQVQPDHKKELPDRPKHSREEQMQIIHQLRMMNTEVSLQLADEMEKKLNPE